MILAIHWVPSGNQREDHAQKDIDHRQKPECCRRLTKDSQQIDRRRTVFAPPLWGEALVDPGCWQMREAQQEFAHSENCARQIDANAQLAQDPEVDVGPKISKHNLFRHWVNRFFMMFFSYYIKICKILHPVKIWSKFGNHTSNILKPLGMLRNAEDLCGAKNANGRDKVMDQGLRLHPEPSEGNSCAAALPFESESAFFHRKGHFIDDFSEILHTLCECNPFKWKKKLQILMALQSILSFVPHPPSAAGILWKPRLKESKTSQPTCASEIMLSWKECTHILSLNIPSNRDGHLVLSPLVVLLLIMIRIISRRSHCQHSAKAGKEESEKEE